MESRPPSRRLRRWIVPGLVLAAVVTAALALGSGWTSMRDLTDWIASYPAVVVLLCMAILPVLGFSVAAVYVVAGVKFGPYAGGLAVAFATVVHLLATHWISRTYLRRPLASFLARRGRHLPHVPRGEDASLAAMAALVPGLPYFARNYLLALAGVPLRTYFWICLPIYVLRSYIPLLFGNAGADLNLRSLLLFGGIYAVKLGVCAYLLWRIRRRLGARAAPVVS